MGQFFCVEFPYSLFDVLIKNKDQELLQVARQTYGNEVESVGAGYRTAIVLWTDFSSRFSPGAGSGRKKREQCCRPLFCHTPLTVFRQGG
jgi:hypothetical protein